MFLFITDRLHRYNYTLHCTAPRCAALVRERKLQVDAHRKDDSSLEALGKGKWLDLLSPFRMTRVFSRSS